MSKEPIKRDEEQTRAQREGRTVVEGVAVTESEPTPGWKHGYTDQQIARIEAEINPPDPVATKESAAVKPAAPEVKPVEKPVEKSHERR